MSRSLFFLIAAVPSVIKYTRVLRAERHTEMKPGAIFNLCGRQSNSAADFAPLRPTQTHSMSA